MIDQLRQLIQRYSVGDMNYGEFRSAFVRFMSASDQDPVLERLYNFIEGLCSGLDHGYVSELGLKFHLQQIVPSSAVARQNLAVSPISDFVVFVSNAVGVQVATASNNAYRISSPVANPSFSDEPQLEPLLSY